MCGLAEASLAATVVSGIMQAYGQYQQGQQKKAEADYEAAILRNNQIRANQLAENTRERGKLAEQKERLRGRLLIGQMRAVLGGSGQVVDEGSAGDLVVDQAEQNELDALTVRHNYELEAQEQIIRGNQFGSQANLVSLSGDNAASSGAFSAGGTLLGTAGTVAGRWYNFKKTGTLSF